MHPITGFRPLSTYPRNDCSSAALTARSCCTLFSILLHLGQGLLLSAAVQVLTQERCDIFSLGFTCTPS